MDSMQWPKIATEDLRQGGSLWVEMKSPVFLAGKGHHHRFFFVFLFFLTLTRRQLRKINIEHCVIIYYCVSAPCNAKMTSFDLRNNLWGKAWDREDKWPSQGHTVGGRARIWIQSECRGPYWLRREPEHQVWPDSWSQSITTAELNTSFRAADKLGPPHHSSPKIGSKAFLWIYFWQLPSSPNITHQPPRQWWGGTGSAVPEVWVMS